MKKLLFTIIALVGLSCDSYAQTPVQVGSGVVRQLCVGEGSRAFHKVNAKYCYYKPNNEVAAGRKVKAWVDDRDATLWAHNCTDVNEKALYSMRYRAFCEFLKDRNILIFYEIISF